MGHTKYGWRDMPNAGIIHRLYSCRLCTIELTVIRPAHPPTCRITLPNLITVQRSVNDLILRNRHTFVVWLVVRSGHVVQHAKLGVEWSGVARCGVVCAWKDMFTEIKGRALPCRAVPYRGKADYTG